MRDLCERWAGRLQILHQVGWVTRCHHRTCCDWCGVRTLPMCVYTPELSYDDTISSTCVTNANCLRISNEPLKYQTQWLRPPDARPAKTAGTHARNVAVNESPTGWVWAMFDPGNDFPQIIENFLMNAVRQCPFKDIGTVKFMSQTVDTNLVCHDTVLPITFVMAIYSQDMSIRVIFHWETFKFLFRTVKLKNYGVNVHSVV